jgi:hypothetical protein
LFLLRRPNFSQHISFLISFLFGVHGERAAKQTTTEKLKKEQERQPGYNQKRLNTV